MPPPKTKAQMTRDHNKELETWRRLFNEKAQSERDARAELERANKDLAELTASLNDLAKKSDMAAQALTEEHKRVAFLQGYIARFLDDTPPAPITPEKLRIIDQIFETMTSGSGPGFNDFPRRY